jgi:hypothetical protein
MILRDQHAVHEGPLRAVATVSAPSVEPGRACGSCGHALASRRSQARFCSSGCRHRAWRLRVGCVRCRGRLVLEPTALELDTLDDAVTLAACAPLDAVGVDRLHQARRALRRLAAQIHGHGGRDG